MTEFREFVDKKTREAKRQLEIVSRVLQKNGMRVLETLDDDDPYIFVPSPEHRLSFDGVRLYRIGDNLAFRVQKEAKTHPYGKAYPLDVEGMFNDLISDDEYDESKAGKEVMKGIVEELRSFFRKSADAEKDLRAMDISTAGDPLGRVVASTTGTDYASQMTSSNPRNNFS